MAIVPYFNKKDRHATKNFTLRETAMPLARIRECKGSEAADHGGALAPAVTAEQRSV